MIPWSYNLYLKFFFHDIISKMVKISLFYDQILVSYKNLNLMNFSRFQKLKTEKGVCVYEIKLHVMNRKFIN